MRLLFLILLFPVVCVSQNWQRAQDLIEHKKYAEALKLVSTVVSQEPGNLKALETLGDLHAQLLEWESAKNSYSRLIRLNPKNPEAHYKFGGSLAMIAQNCSSLNALKLLSPMRSSFETVLKLQPNHLEARWALLEYYLQVPFLLGGSESKAREYAKELFALSAVDGYLANAHIAEHYERYDEARQYYLQAIKLPNPETARQKLAALNKKIQKKAT